MKSSLEGLTLPVGLEALLVVLAVLSIATPVSAKLVLSIYSWMTRQEWRQQFTDERSATPSHKMSKPVREESNHDLPQ